ncbi:cytochrome P450 315a1, mitochondrial [Maniola jurtina]|uniref:cytochrome P450 315a1, mitochondrial n=1 Tax=Maniola jurtina TaxID=191418 RepID=UPI001E68BEDE|nr:cytochrome P450 315a1, mitochondrial [Maniola jurtina]XP_045772801.1 cytochrome P450 315a1, mitochondrial [Maniola jurtina]
MHRFQKTAALKNNAKRFKATFIKEDTLLSISDMPHPKSLPIIGTRLQLIAAGGGKKLHEYIDARHKQLGPIFTERLAGSTELVFVSDPLIMKSLFIYMEGKYPMHILPDPWVLYEKLYGSHRGLFFMDGEKWLHYRRILNKHLLREGTEDWIRAPIVKSIQHFVNDLKEKLHNGYKIKDFEMEFYRLSTNVLVNVLLGENSIPRSQHYDEMLNRFSDSVKKIFHATTTLYGWPVEWCQYFNLKVWKDFRESVDLSLHLAKKMAFEMIRNKDRNNGLIKKLVQEGLEDEMITRIVADFIIAAGDTTAYTTLWIFLLLCNNVGVIEEIRKKDDTYIKCVVKEAMRMYPVAPFLTRILPKETVFGNYRLQQGTPIIASIYTSGRDEQNFSKPEMFLPYRWDRNDPRRESIDNHITSASLPFAMGARSCIGKKIAQVQLTELVRQVTNHFDIKCKNSKDVKSMTSQVLVLDRQLEFVISLRDRDGS